MLNTPTPAEATARLLTYAAEGESTGVFVCCACFKGDPFATNERGEDAVTIARNNGHDDTVRVLLELQGEPVQVHGLNVDVN